MVHRSTALGSSQLAQGSVLDMSPAQPGTAAISDADMTPWMEYVHQMDANLMNNPPNVKGVDVSVDTIDPNNNFVHLGDATSDSTGKYSLAFTPEVPGLYKIIATFAGSESYWPSHAITYFTVEEAPATTPEPTPTPASAADLYFVPMSIGTIVAIIVVGLLLFLMLRKR